MTLIRDTGNALKKSTQLTLYSSYPKAVLMSYFHRKKPTQRKLQVRHDMLNENSMKWSMQYYGRNSIVFGEKSKQLFRRRAFWKAQTTTHGGFRFIKTRAYNIVLISPLRSCLANTCMVNITQRHQRPQGIYNISSILQLNLFLFKINSYAPYRLPNE
jgi:hypothetical protein